MCQSKSAGSFRGRRLFGARSAPAFVFLACVFVLAGPVGADAAEPKTGWSVQPFLQGAADGMNAYTLDLFAHLAGNTDRNVVLSPFSLHGALSMVAYGAKGQTRDELLAALRMALPYPVRNRDSLHTAFAYLRGYLVNESRAFAAANIVVHAAGLRTNASYAKGVAENYRGDIAAMDFAKPAEAVREINAWVGKHTDGAVAELLSGQTVTADTKLLVLNAVVFRGRWAEAFSPADTAPGDFHAAGGKVGAEYMNAVRPLPVAVVRDDELDAETGERGDLARLLAIPFSGGKWEMLFFLPESMEAFLEKLVPAKLCEWLDGYDRQKSLPAAPIALRIPKFAFSWKAEGLVDAFRKMGVAKAFEQAGADFSGIAGGNLCLSEIVSEARIEVDEAGAEAAAASAVMMGKGLPDEFALDRPFVFMLRHTGSGAVTMIGKVSAPAIE